MASFPREAEVGGAFSGNKGYITPRQGLNPQVFGWKSDFLHTELYGQAMKAVSHSQDLTLTINSTSPVRKVLA